MQTPQIAPVLLALVVLLTGCQDDGTVPVYGTVSFADGSLPEGCRLFFQPLEVAGESRPCFATIEKDGTYQVFAFKDAGAKPTVKGLVPGKYALKVVYYDLQPGANPDFESSWTESTRDLGEVVVDADADHVEHDIDVPLSSSK